MTGPTSWMQFQDVHVTSGRSEAWSELLGLRSNPRTTAQSMVPPDNSFFSSAPCPPSPSGQGFDSLFGPLSSSSSESTRRQPLDLGLSAVPSGKSTSQPMPASGLHTLDPFFYPPVGGSGRLNSGVLSPVSSSNTIDMPGSLWEVSSQPMLRKTPRGELTRETSHNAIVGEGQSLRQTKPLSPVTSEALLQHESYRRAALDFVLELAGPQAPLPSGDSCHISPPDVIKSDELPIPAFAINRDAHVCMWNKQMEEICGVDADEVIKGSSTLGDVFQPDGTGLGRSRGCLELMRSVLFGLSVPPETPFMLRKKTKNGGKGASSKVECVPVELRFSRRTDMVGSVCGVLCAVAPIKLPPSVSVKDGSPRKTFVTESSASPHEPSAEALQESAFLFDRCPMSNSTSNSSGISTLDASQLSPTSSHRLDSTSTTPLSLDLVYLGTQFGVPSNEASPPEVRALVMESVDTMRMELKQNLERCGLGVTGCSSLGEAMWRFERSLVDPSSGPHFDVIFLELEPNGDELFLAVRDLRRLEEEARVTGQVPALDSVHQAVAVSSARSAASSASEAPAIEEIAGEGDGDSKVQLLEQLERDGAGVDSEECSESEDDMEQSLGVSSLPKRKSKLVEGSAMEDSHGSEEDHLPDLLTKSHAGTPSPERERRCLILAVVNLNRWNLAALDLAMEQCVRAGGDAVIPRGMPLQQLKTAMRKLGVRSKYLMIPSRLPRALSGNPRSR